MSNKRSLTEKQAYTRIAASERSGEFDEEKEEEEPGSEDEKSSSPGAETPSKASEERRSGLSGSRRSGRSSRSRTPSSSEFDGEEGYDEDYGDEEGGEEEARTHDSETSALLESGDADGTGAGRKGKAGKKKAGKGKADSAKTSATGTIAFQSMVTSLPWRLIAIVGSSGGCCLIFSSYLFMTWCVYTNWGPWQDCQPSAPGADHCLEGVSKRYRERVRGNCMGQASVESRQCDMGPCVLPDLLQAERIWQCTIEKRAHLLAKAQQVYSPSDWGAFASCPEAFLCCFSCTSFYAGASSLTCGGRSIQPKAIYTANGCLSCFPSTEVALPEFKHRLVFTKNFDSGVGSHTMCCMRILEHLPMLKTTTTSTIGIEEHFRIDKHNFHRREDTSAFLGVLHRPYAWPVIRHEAECQRLCWLDAECYLYSYVTERSHVARWRGRCVTWDRPTADLYRRSSPDMWVPEDEVMSGFKYAVRFSDIVVTVETSNLPGSGSSGPFVLYVCRLLHKCQVHSPVRLTATACRGGENCLMRGTTQRFVSVVAVPHEFHFHAVLIESFTPDEWIFERISVDIDGQIGDHKGTVKLHAPKSWSFAIGCTTTSGWHVTAPVGSVCKSKCFDGYGIDGWCWADDTQTLWGACVPACAKIHNEVKTASHNAETSGMSCAELDWPTWSPYNKDRAVCASSQDRPLHGCSGKLSWEAAREFCLAAGARLCTKDELEADEAAGTGCGLDRRAVWTSTACPDGSYVAVAGASQHLHEVPATCTQPAGESAAARCCADSRKLVITFSKNDRDTHSLPGRLSIRNSGGLSNWMVVAGTDYHGKPGFFLQSGMLDDQAPHDDQFVDVVLDQVAIAERGGEIEFIFRIDSEIGADELHFYIDGKEERRAGFPVSGKIDWKLARFAFPEKADGGLHEFRWRYRKDSSHSLGHDVACLDKIIVYGIVGLE